MSMGLECGSSDLPGGPVVEMDCFCFSGRALLAGGGVWTDVISMVDAFPNAFAAFLDASVAAVVLSALSLVV